MTYTEIIDGEPVEKIVQDPIPASHDEVSHDREIAYESLVDKLHLRKLRKTVLGEWTEELEAEYVAKVKELSDKIAELHPYPEDLIPEPVEPAEEEIPAEEPVEEPSDEPVEEEPAEEPAEESVEE